MSPFTLIMMERKCPSNLITCPFLNLNFRFSFLYLYGHFDGKMEEEITGKTIINLEASASFEQEITVK